VRCTFLELFVTLAYVGVLRISSFSMCTALCNPALLPSSLISLFCISCISSCIFCLSSCISSCISLFICVISCITSSVFWFAYVFMAFAVLVSSVIVCFSSFMHLEIFLKYSSDERVIWFVLLDAMRFSSLSSSPPLLFRALPSMLLEESIGLFRQYPEFTALAVI